MELRKRSGRYPSMDLPSGLFSADSPRPPAASASQPRENRRSRAHSSVARLFGCPLLQLGATALELPGCPRRVKSTHCEMAECGHEPPLPIAAGSRESGRSNDRNLAALIASASDGIQFGNLNSRSIAWKRGSRRSGSRSGSVFKLINCGSRSCRAVSSHVSASRVLPHCA